jgi:hypothetical protein
MYEPRQILDCNFYDVRNRTLDIEINSSEIYNVLLTCKNGKSPGFDGISAEFYKALPKN